MCPCTYETGMISSTGACSKGGAPSWPSSLCNIFAFSTTKSTPLQRGYNLAWLIAAAVFSVPSLRLLLLQLALCLLLREKDNGLSKGCRDFTHHKQLVCTMEKRGLLLIYRLLFFDLRFRFL